MIPESTLSILACPVSKASLVQEADYLVSTDEETRLRYRIEEGIPVMIAEEAETLDVDEWSEIMQKHGAGQ